IADPTAAIQILPLGGVNSRNVIINRGNNVTIGVTDVNWAGLDRITSSGDDVTVVYPLALRGRLRISTTRNRGTISPGGAGNDITVSGDAHRILPGGTLATPSIVTINQGDRNVIVSPDRRAIRVTDNGPNTRINAF